MKKRGLAGIVAIILVLVGGGLWWDQATSKPAPARSTSQSAGRSSASHSTKKAKTKPAKKVKTSGQTSKDYPFKTITQQAMGQLKGHNSVAIATSFSDDHYQWHNQAQRAASDIKVFILATVYHQVDQGKYQLSGHYTLRDADKVGGTGSLQGMAAGTTVTNQQLLHYMMTVSDNTATNITLRQVGGLGVVNRYARDLGAKDTHVVRKMMDQKALDAGKDNLTSVADLSMVLMKLWRHQLISTSADTAMLKLMSENTNHSKLPKDVPTDRTVYNKTGEFDTYGVENDAAIFAKGGKAVVVVAMSEGGQLGQQVPAMNRLGQQVDHAVFG
ncbi:serine hydrolase [Levilactobacillus tangyuanensis]|uniref:Serine hydrolase n=1 Tax=Levilactobacillus tangyuanensis TaxID=2486021 RepID=A0ABW1TKX4_9LACO|nr:serine hydrolase [Levilactobacillus tangyuanensis]